MLITDTRLDTFEKVSLNAVRELSITPDDNKDILTIQDNVSEYCILVPIPDISATTVAHIIVKHLFSQHAALNAIHTGRGGSFVNDPLRKVLKNFEGKQITTSGFSPKLRRSLKRSYAVLMDKIRLYAETYDWFK